MAGQSINDRLTAARYSLAGQGLAKSVCKATTEEVIGPKKKHLDCEYRRLLSVCLSVLHHHHHSSNINQSASQSNTPHPQFHRGVACFLPSSFPPSSDSWDVASRRRRISPPALYRRGLSELPKSMAFVDGWFCRLLLLFVCLSVVLSLLFLLISSLLLL